MQIVRTHEDYSQPDWPWAGVAQGQGGPGPGRPRAWLAQGQGLASPAQILDSTQKS